MQNIEELKSFLNLKIQEEDQSISSLYMEYVRPFCSMSQNFNEFITPNEVLFSIPPGIVKIRRYFFQVLVLMDILRFVDGKPDPLPNENMKDIIFLIRSIALLAPVISNTILSGIFEELHSIHGDFYPQSILFLMKSIGITENDIGQSFFEIHASNPSRIHYDDGQSTPSGLEFQPNKTTLQNFPIFQSTECKEIQFKRPKHGPKTSMKSSH